MLIERQQLLKRIEQSQPRVILLVAPPGYGKTVIARALAQGSGGAGDIVDCYGVKGIAQFARRLTASLAAAAPHRLADLARLRMLYGDDVDGLADALVSAFAAPAQPSTIIIDNAEHLAAHADCLELLERIVRSSAPSRRIVVCSRAELKDVAGAISPAELVKFGPSDLRFTDEELDRLFSSLNDAARRLAKSASGGWPIAAMMLRRYEVDQLPASLLSLLESRDIQALQAYVEQNLVAALPAAVRSAFQVVAFVPNASEHEVIFAAPEGARGLRELAEESPFVDFDGGRYRVHPMVRAALETGADVQALELQQKLAVFASEHGDRIRAAELYTSAELEDRAAFELEPLILEFLDGMVPATKLFECIAALDSTTLARHPLLLLAWTAQRMLPLDPELWIAHAETIWRSLEPDAPAGVVLVIFSSLIAAYAHIGRYDDAERTLREYEARSPELGIREMIGIYGWRACLAALREQIDLAEALIPQARDVMVAPAAMAVFIQDVVARVARLRGDFERERDALYEALSAAEQAGLPQLVALIRCDLATNAFTRGDARDFEEHVTRIEQSPAVESNPTRFYVECARGRGRAADVDTRIPAFAAFAAAIGAGTCADEREAMRLFSVAADAAARSGQGYVVRFVERMRRLGNAPAADRSQGEGRIHLALLDAAAFVGEGVRRLGVRQLEVLWLLARSRRPLALAELAAIVHPDRPERVARNALKVLIRRLRQELGDESIVSSSTGYELGASVSVDIRRHNAMLRALRPDQPLTAAQRSEVNALLEALSRRPRLDLRLREWFAEEEMRLAQWERRALLLLGQDALLRGDAATALGFAQRMVRADPLDEPARELAVRAHCMAGETGEAARELRGYRDLLGRELGIELPERLRSLVGDYVTTM